MLSCSLMEVVGWGPALPFSSMGWVPGWSDVPPEVPSQHLDFHKDPPPPPNGMRQCFLLLTSCQKFNHSGKRQELPEQLYPGPDS